MVGILRYCIKIFNKIVALIILLMFILFYFIMFEVPIPIVSDKISNHIKDNYKNYFPQESEFSLGSISFSWNYTINRPIVLIKKIIYKNQGNEIIFEKVGIYPDIKKLLFNKQIAIKKLYLDGFNFLLIEKDGKIDFDFFIPEKPSANNISITNNQNTKDIKNKVVFDANNPYKSFENIKKNNLIFANLDELAFTNLKILFVENNIDFFSVNFNKLIFKTTASNFVFNLQSQLIFSEVLQSNIKLDAVLEKNNDLFINLDVENLEISKISKRLYPYFPSIQKLKINKLPLNVNIDANYNLVSKNIKKLYGDISIKDGSILYKDYFNKTIALQSLLMKVNYNDKANIVSVNDVKIKFVDNNVIALKNFGSEISLRDVSAKIDYNLNNNNIYIKDGMLADAKNDIGFNIDFIDNSKENYVINVDVHSSKVQMNYLKNIFPSLLNTSLKNWIDTSIHKSNIEGLDVNLKFAIDKKSNVVSLSSLSGETKMNDVSLSYLSTMPEMDVENLLLKFDSQSLTIDYKNLTTLDLFSSNGNVSVVDYDANLAGYQAYLKLNMDVEGEVVNILQYINNKPLNLADKYNLTIDNFKGKAVGNFKFGYLFATEDNIKDLDINFKLSDFVYKNVFNNIDATDGNLDFILSNNKLEITGSTLYLNQKANLDILFQWGDKSIQNYKIIFDKFDITNAKKLTILPQNLIENATGDSQIKINYTSSGSTSNIIFDVNLLYNAFNIKELSYSKQVEEPFLVYGDMNINNNTKDYDIKTLLITSNNLNANMSLKINDKSKEINIKTMKLNNNFNFNGNFFVDDKSIKAFIRGKSIDITYFLDNIKNKNNQNNKVNDIKIENNKQQLNSTSNNTTKEYYIDIDINRIYSGKKYLKNSVFKLDFSNKSLNSLFLNANFSSKNTSYITFNNTDNTINGKIYNIGYLLQFFNLTDSVRNGDLDAKIVIKTQLNDNTDDKIIISKGDMLINNVVVGVNFSTALLSFEGKDYYFDINKIKLVGNVMGGEMRGYLDFDKKYLDISGRLIPIWGANNLLSNAPIIKNLIGNKNYDKNILEFNTAVRGPLSALEYTLFDKKDKSIPKQSSTQNLPTNATDESAQQESTQNQQIYSTSKNQITEETNSNSQNMQNENTQQNSVLGIIP